MKSLLELPYIIFAGAAIGSTAALFIFIQKKALRLQKYPVFPRLVMAGLITGSVAYLIPQIMSIGYDTVQSALVGELGLAVLVTALIAKIFVTPLCLGLGMPGGVIGPTFFIGACFGGILGYCGNSVFPEYAATPGFYVMLGMGAMMGACLNAPLAALMAVLELTSNTNVILPSMLIILVANLIRSELFKQQTVFHTLKNSPDAFKEQTPFALVLQRAAVSSIMDRDLRVTPPVISLQSAFSLISKMPRWLVTEDENKKTIILKTSDLAHHVEKIEDQSNSIDLLSIPSNRRLDALPISIKATLAEAADIFDTGNTEALTVEQQAAPLHSPIVGIILRENIADYYRIPYQMPHSSAPKA